MNKVKQLKSGKYAVVENGKNVLVTNNYGDIPDKKRAFLAAAAPTMYDLIKREYAKGRINKKEADEIFDFVERRSW